VKDYLKERNLAIDADALYDKAVRRSDILSLHASEQTVSFKHRSFAEFLYAKYLFKTGGLVVDERVFSLYWMNTYFFYLGIEKDSPAVLSSIIGIEPKSEDERWMRIINCSNYLLAAYATPYSIISEAVTNIITDAAQLYLDVADGRVHSMFSSLSRAQLLWLSQYLVRQNYSFEFFKSALEERGTYNCIRG
jgi:hypothetical protein